MPSESFSKRMGITPKKLTLQNNSMDNDLRHGLWNAFHLFFAESDNTLAINISKAYPGIRELWLDFYKLPLDTIPYEKDKVFKQIKTEFLSYPWNRVYDFIEFIARMKFFDHNKKEHFIAYCNKILERELSGFRFIVNTISPITDENELKIIEEAIENSNQTKFSRVNEHLKSAVLKISDRENPDYRNSIKESISAVESISQIISGVPNTTLGKALDHIEKTGKITIHSSLKEGFKKIYGWTSDHGGIRHALSEGSDCYFEDAKYILASCSAFINYLIIKSDKAGINI